MIITDIRVGSQQVYKVYLGNKLIWQWMKDTPAFGKAASETAATGSLTFFAEVIKAAKATSFSGAEAQMHLQGNRKQEIVTQFMQKLQKKRDLKRLAKSF